MRFPQSLLDGEGVADHRCCGGDHPGRPGPPDDLGRQFWRVTGGYFGGHSASVWAWLGVLLFLTLITVRLNVLLSYQANDLYSSLQVAFEGAGAGNDAVRDSGVHGFWTAIVVFVLIAAVYIGRQLVDIYLTQRFIIRWRVWLTDRLAGDWLDDEAFYRGRFLHHPSTIPTSASNSISTPSPPAPEPARTPHGRHHDDPAVQCDQRDGVGGGVHADSVEPVGPLTVLGFTFHHALFWIALMYVFATTVIAFWIGRPLIRFSFPQRTDQRRLPLRPGADARRRRVDPSTGRRGRKVNPAIAFRGDR